MLFAGWPLPIWIRDSTDNIQYSNHTIMPKSARSLCNQASTLPGAVRYLENTMQCKMFPHYKKPCAPSLVRLGLHRSLVGGMSSRPSFAVSRPCYSSDIPVLCPSGPKLPFECQAPSASAYRLACARIRSADFTVIPGSSKSLSKVQKLIRLKKPLTSLS